MTFPVPPDARGVGDFEIVRGMDDMMRQSLPMYDTTVDYDVGEWLKPVTDTVTKMRKLESGNTVSAPALGCKVCWTRYRAADGSGQTDAMATKTLDMLSGTYQAKTKFYNSSTGSFAPGYLLVPVYHATKGGILDAPVPGAMTVAQLQGVVARVIEVLNGVLHYEAPGL